MQFRVAKITGVDDALISLLISKRNYTPEKADYIRELVNEFSSANGAISLDPSERAEELADKLGKLTKYGLKLGYKKNHETLLRFIYITIETQGLHKAGMGDLDAHAMRMDNCIVRTATRLSAFSPNERSDYYKGKILNVAEALEYGHFFNETKDGEVVDRYVEDLPEFVERDDAIYKFNGCGYVRTDCWDDQDVQRGTYPLSIPSDAIWKANFISMRHIYAMRNEYTHAHPELTLGMEQVAHQVFEMLPILGVGLSHEWVSDKWAHVSNVRFSTE